VRGVVRDPSSARPFGGLELGVLEQVSDEELVARTAATPGSAVALLTY
jgi:hypothetical protein